MSILTTSEITSITNEIGSIISDSVISTSIRYEKSGTSVEFWDPTDGEIPEMYAVSSVSSFKGSYTVDEVESSGGLLEYGDVKFILMSSTVSGIVSPDDRIVEYPTNYQSGTTYEVININRDPLNICYFLQARVC